MCIYKNASGILRCLQSRGKERRLFVTLVIETSRVCVITSVSDADFSVFLADPVTNSDMLEQHISRACCRDFPKSGKNSCSSLLSLWKIQVSTLTALLPATFPSQFLFCSVLLGRLTLAALSPSLASRTADRSRKALRMRRARLGGGVRLGFLKLSSHTFNSILRFVLVVACRKSTSSTCIFHLYNYFYYITFIICVGKRLPEKRLCCLQLLCQLMQLL